MKRSVASVLIFVSGFSVALYFVPKTFERDWDLEVHFKKGPGECRDASSRDCAYAEMKEHCRAGNFDGCKQAYELFHIESDRYLIVDHGETPCLEDGPQRHDCTAVFTAKYKFESAEAADSFAIKLQRAARLNVGATEILRLTKVLCDSSKEPNVVYVSVCEHLKREPSASWDKLKNIRVNAYYSRAGETGVYQQNFAEYLGLDRKPAETK